jgi:hypothetical protein
MDQRRLLTEEDVIAADEAAARRLANWRRLFRFSGAALLLILIALTDPVHAWLHAHLQFLAGIFVGSTLEAAVWSWDDWRKLRKRRHAQNSCDSYVDS